MPVDRVSLGVGRCARKTPHFVRSRRKPVSNGFETKIDPGFRRDDESRCVCRGALLLAVLFATRTEA